MERFLGQSLMDNIRRRADELSIQVMALEELERTWMKLKRPSIETNKFLFINLPNHCLPENILTIFYNTQLLGYIPVIFEAERNFEVQLNPGILNRLIRHGVLIHINSGSLLKKNGKSDYKAAIKLSKKGLVTFILPNVFNKESTTEDEEKLIGLLERKFSYEQVLQWKRNRMCIENGSPFVG